MSKLFSRFARVTAEYGIPMDRNTPAGDGWIYERAKILSQDTTSKEELMRHYNNLRDQDLVLGRVVTRWFLQDNIRNNFYAAIYNESAQMLPDHSSGPGVKKIGYIGLFRYYEPFGRVHDHVGVSADPYRVAAEIDLLSVGDAHYQHVSVSRCPVCTDALDPNDVELMQSIGLGETFGSDHALQATKTVIRPGYLPPLNEAQSEQLGDFLEKTFAQTDDNERP